MKQRKRIVLDCDDVLLNWSAGFKRFVESQTHHRQAINENTVFSIGSQYGMSVADGLEWVERFNAHGQFGELEPTPGAKQAVQWLLADEFNIYIITACGNSPANKTLRHRNLDYVFGPHAFKEVVFAPGGHSKVEYLKDFDGCFFVDDHTANVEAARMQTYTIPVLFENYMNRHLAWDGPRINSLVDFYNIHIAEKTNAA